MGRKRAIVREPWEKHGWQTCLGSAAHSRTPRHRHPGARPARGRPGPRPRPPGIPAPRTPACRDGAARTGPRRAQEQRRSRSAGLGQPRCCLGARACKEPWPGLRGVVSSFEISAPPSLNAPPRPPHLLSPACRASCARTPLMSLWERGWNTRHVPWPGPPQFWAHQGNGVEIHLGGKQGFNRR